MRVMINLRSGMMLNLSKGGPVRVEPDFKSRIDVRGR